MAVAGVSAHLVLRYVAFTDPAAAAFPLEAVLLIGGVPLVWRLGRNALRLEFGADHLAGVSIVASAWLGEHLAGALVVLMLSGGEALEAYAVAEATSVLRALAKRVPTLAHRERDGVREDVAVVDLRVGDEIAILPHEVCGVDGDVTRGRGRMDESSRVPSLKRVSICWQC